MPTSFGEEMPELVDENQDAEDDRKERIVPNSVPIFSAFVEEFFGLRAGVPVDGQDRFERVRLARPVPPDDFADDGAMSVNPIRRLRKASTAASFGGVERDGRLFPFPEPAGRGR